jgi:ATP-dependent Clp protease ATP-binding subunit ClpB
VSFRNTIVIMTSNVGSQFIQEFAGSDDEESMRRLVEDAMRVTFRPEFLNRIDDIVVFHSLSLEQIGDIVNLQLEIVRKRLAERKIALELTGAAVERISLEGFDPVFGARPLKRVIQREVVDRIAKAMIDGTVGEGDSVVIDIVEDEIAVRSVGHTSG